MAITPRSQDKYALLFTGPTGVNRFILDIEKVFNLLVAQYSYDPGNITVVVGSTAATPSVPDATIVTALTEGQLRVALDSFAGNASGPATGMPTMDNSAILYFTGGGLTETGVSKLVIDGGTSSVDPNWLQARLNGFSDCHVNLIMEQSFGGGFLPALTGSTLTQWSFTSACSATEESYGNDGTDPTDPVQGSYFTDGWVRGLSLEELPVGTPNAGQFADTLGPGAQATDRLISFEEDLIFAVQMVGAAGYGALMTPTYSDSGSPQYPGLPELLIRDSDPGHWWESPDVVLTHPNHPWLPPGDLYIYDDPANPQPQFNNTINVTVRNVGTHPVRALSLGVELFKSGIGPVSYQPCDIIPSGGKLLPIEHSDIGTAADQVLLHLWNTEFESPATHTCVKAEAKLHCADVDSDWSVAARDFEAQRNLDEMTVIPMPVLPELPEWPEWPEWPWPFPEIQGFKEHRFNITNPFEVQTELKLVLPKQAWKLPKGVTLRWFGQAAGPGGERTPLQIREEPVPHIPFLLGAGEGLDLFLTVEMKQDTAFDGEILLPFEILAARQYAEDMREPLEEERLPYHAAVGGITVRLKAGKAATVRGRILDAEGRPAAGAAVFLRTANGLHGATVTTDDEGRYVFANINPDVYRLSSSAAEGAIIPQTLVLLEDAKEELELTLTEPATPGKRIAVILDKIRILNDKDPCLHGRGELVFTTRVTPDHNPAASKTLRLPGTGVYRIWDKPGRNDLQLGVVIFEGHVCNDHLEIGICGKEIDTFDKDDQLTRYHRIFTGQPETWAGQYRPNDEYLDAEDVGEWLLWYRIVNL